MNWLLDNKFYSLTTTTFKNDQIFLARIGANDPEYNLRREPAIIFRKKNTKNTVFASIIESHGTYSPVSEFAVNAYSNIQQVAVIYDDKNYTAIQIKTTKNTTAVFIISNTDASEITQHTLQIKDATYTWKGAFTYQKVN